MTAGRPPVRVEDVQAAGLCVRGLRRWCRAYGLDLRVLLRDGMPVEELRRIAETDEYARRVLAAYRRRLADGGR